MREYTITRKPQNLTWDQIPAAPIDQLLWCEPVDICAEARLCYDEDSIYVHLSAKETNIRAEENGPLGHPCEDSCLEFFFSPISGDTRYFNIEFNPNGCMYLGIGKNRYDSVRLLPNDTPIDPLVERTQDGWQITYRIPCSFIRRFFPEFSPASGGTIRANCYKCGDLTVTEHYLAWNYIDSEIPNFHLPEHFGIMRFA